MSLQILVPVCWIYLCFAFVRKENNSRSLRYIMWIIGTDRYDVTRFLLPSVWTPHTYWYILPTYLHIALPRIPWTLKWQCVEYLTLSSTRTQLHHHLQTSWSMELKNTLWNKHDSHWIVFWIHPTRLTVSGSQARAELMNTCSHWHNGEECNDALRCKCPSVSRAIHPGGDEELFWQRSIKRDLYV